MIVRRAQGWDGSWQHPGDAAPVGELRRQFSKLLAVKGLQSGDAVRAIHGSGNYALQDKGYDRWTYTAENRAAIARWNKFARKILSKKAAQKSMTKAA
jgi:hypothetical protein